MVYHYYRPEWFERVEKPELSPEDTIILWGAGKIGSIVAHAVEKRGLRVKAFVDIAKDKQGTTFCGHPVISPKELYKNDTNAVVIVSCAFPIVYEELQQQGVLRVYAPCFLLLEVDFDGYKGGLTYEFATRMIENALRNYAMYLDKGSLIEDLFFVITDKCTLNCKNCDGYIPYHTHPRNDNVCTLFASYEKVIHVCKKVKTINIMGGETLLHPDLPEIVQFFVNDSRCDAVTLISNGTILPAPKLVEVLKSPKVVFRLSDYGKLSKKKEEIVQLFHREGIRYEITNYTYWDEVPLIEPQNQTYEQLKAKFSACTGSFLHIKYGKLFLCRFAEGFSDLGVSTLPNLEANYVDLCLHDDGKVTEGIERLIKRIYDREPIDACRYCPGGHCILFENKVPVAEQAKGKLPLEMLFKGRVRLCD